VFGRYQLVERIAVGGMAEIYRGRMVGPGGFEKPVAIKKILPRLARDERFIRLLVNEAKINASLSHANIVQIHDLGLNEEGEYFLVLEYVHGRDLRAILEESRAQGLGISKECALFVVGEVCAALDHAHLMAAPDGKPLGLIHRDVSPANILCSYAGEVKLTDFGIAKQIEEASIVGTLKGKFAYMSPEQARSGPLDQTTDLFSLGAILFELLLGCRLFDGPTDFETLQAVREAGITRPRDLVPEFPPLLEAILLKVLSPRPRDRFQSASELGTALREFRFSLSSAGGGATELAALVARLFPADEGHASAEPPPPAEAIKETAEDSASGFITINTIAGFRSEEGTSGAIPLPHGVAAAASMTPSFDLEPTAVAGDPRRAFSAAAVEAPLVLDPLGVGELEAPARGGSTQGRAAPPHGQVDARRIAALLFTPVPDGEFREGTPIHIESSERGFDESTVPGEDGPTREKSSPTREDTDLAKTRERFTSPVLPPRLRPRRWPWVLGAWGLLAAGVVLWLVRGASPSPPAVGRDPVSAGAAVPDRGPTQAPAPATDPSPSQPEVQGGAEAQGGAEPEGSAPRQSDPPSPGGGAADTTGEPALSAAPEARRPAEDGGNRRVGPVPLAAPSTGGRVHSAAAVRRVESANHLNRSEPTTRRGRPPNGEVVVRSEPGARIHVDGRDIGRSTSATPFRLPVGRHDITLINSALHLRKSFIVIVHADEITRRFISLR
jgi:hypothetical protein